MSHHQPRPPSGGEGAEPTWQQKGAATAIGISAEEYIEHIEAGERWCWACRRWRAEDLFRLRWKDKPTRHAHCIDCYREYMRVYMRGRARVVQGAAS